MIVTVLLAATALFISTANATNPVNFRAVELKARADDAAAINYYRVALNELEALQAKRKNTREEAILEMRVLDTMNKMLAIQFRISHGPKATARDVSDYNHTLNRMMEVCSDYTKKFPRAPDIARTVFLRAKVYQELGREADAIKNFRYYLDYFKNGPDYVNAEFSLYDLFMKNKDYKSALDYLHKFTISTTDPYYTLLLDHLAFTYYYINDIPKAVYYILQELRYATSNANTEREKVLSNCVLFYFSGIDGRVPNYSLAGVFNFIKSLQPGAYLGKTLSYAAKLFRAKGYVSELETFKRSIFADTTMPKLETLNFGLMLLEGEVEKRQYPNIQETVQHMAAFIETSSRSIKELPPAELEKIQRSLTDTVAILQPQFERQKGTVIGHQIASTLISVDNMLIGLSNNSPNAFKVHYNLAETLYLMKNYSAAVVQYRWIVENARQGSSLSASIVEDSKLKSIISMYEILEAKGLSAKDLKAQPLSLHTPAVAPEITEWIKWIDQCDPKKNQAQLENFTYEANRLLYSQGKIQEVVGRMVDFIHARPNSKFMVPSASLIMDTYIVSQKWNELYAFATELLRMKPLQDPHFAEFKQKVNRIRADTYFKITEDTYKAQNYQEALKRVDTFLLSSRTEGFVLSNEDNTRFLTLAANAALALKNKKLALTYFSRIQKGNLNLDTQGQSLLTAGSVAEDSYDLESAAKSFERYLAIPKAVPQASKEMRTKTILYAWFSGKPAFLQEILKDRNVCNDTLSGYCEDFHAILPLMPPQEKVSRALSKKAYEHAHRGTPGSRAEWATLALENPQAFTYEQKFELLNVAAEGWSTLDPFTKLSLLPYLSVSIPETLRLAGQDIHSASPVSLQKEAIQKRAGLIEKMESTLQRMVKLPWARIRALSINEWANLYASFSGDLLALPKPAGLSAEDLTVYNQALQSVRDPFIKKNQELRKQALESAMNSGIEATDYQKVSKIYESENPASVKAPVKASDGFTPPSENTKPLLEPAIFGKLRVPPEWSQVAVQAAQAGNWVKLEYLIQDAQTRGWLKEGRESIAHAGLLCMAGAQAEGLAELEAHISELSGELESQALTALIRGFYGARNAEKIKKFSALVKSVKDLDPRFGPELSLAFKWAEVEGKD